MAQPSIDDIAKSFVQYYYALFDGDRQQLVNLYQDQSMLTFENDKFQGKQNIMAKLTNLAFTSIKHVPTTIDAQPAPGNGVLVFVCGNLAVDGSNQPIKYSQVFTLLPTGQAGGYYVLNDMFRLNYC